MRFMVTVFSETLGTWVVVLRTSNADAALVERDKHLRAGRLVQFDRL